MILNITNRYNIKSLHLYIIFTVEFYFNKEKFEDRCNLVKPLSKYCEGFSFGQGDAKPRK